MTLGIKPRNGHFCRLPGMSILEGVGGIDEE